MSIVRLHAIISGIVQGVYLRASTVDRAQELRLTGWVRNLHDGTVECVAEGDQDRLDELVVWWRSSPGSSTVRDVQLDRLAPTGEFSEFRTEWTTDRAETT